MAPFSFHSNRLVDVLSKAVHIVQKTFHISNTFIYFKKKFAAIFLPAGVFKSILFFLKKIFQEFYNQGVQMFAKTLAGKELTMSLILLWSSLTAT